MPNKPVVRIINYPAKEREPQSPLRDLVNKSLATAALDAETSEDLEWLRNESVFSKPIFSITVYPN